MAALNFPPTNVDDGNPTDGMIWTAPTGRQWVYRSNIPGWESMAATGNSNIVYRGGIDLTQDPDTQYNDIEAGNQFAVGVGASPVDNALYPGLGGENISAGQIVMYDGNEWQYLNNVPYATTTVPGVIELATEQEAVDGTDNTKAMTPLRVQQAIPEATIEVEGKTRYATRTEAEAGSVDDAALTPDSIANLLGNLQEAIDRMVPTGMIMWWTAKKDSDLPSGWIKCDGSTISNSGATKSLYEYLRSVGNPWGPSAGSSTVRVPDLRGRFVRGFDDGSNRDPDNSKFGASQSDLLKSHTHGVNDPGHDHNIEGNGYSADSKEPSADVIVDDNLGVPRTSNTKGAKTGVSINAAGGAETRPKNINLTPVIKL